MSSSTWAAPTDAKKRALDKGVASEFDWQRSPQPPPTECQTDDCHTLLNRANIRRVKGPNGWEWRPGRCYPCQMRIFDEATESPRKTKHRKSTDVSSVWEVIEDILPILDRSTEPMSPADIAVACGRSSQKATQALRKLWDMGRVQQVGVGYGDKRRIHWELVRG